jgi:hypothetical protein
LGVVGIFTGQEFSIGADARRPEVDEEGEHVAGPSLTNAGGKQELDASGGKFFRYGAKISWRLT